MMHKDTRIPQSSNSDREYWLDVFSQKLANCEAEALDGNMPYQRANARRWAQHYSRLVQRLSA
jgi:flagellar basal body rod protein FlgC